MTRAALDPGAIELREPWTRLRVVATTGSTNTDLLDDPQARAGWVLAAEHQTAGRGRLDRSWTSPARAGLSLSMRLEPVVPRAAWSWLPLLVGVALRDAVAARTGLDPRLKWPNDLLIDGRKAAGVLMQVRGPAVVVGLGLNVGLRAEELPVPHATSLLLAGAPDLDRTALLAALLAELGRWYARWTAADGAAERCGLRAAYEAVCSSLGAELAVTLADGRVEQGRGVAIGVDGRLVLELAGGGRLEVPAGDVVHASLETP